ncbi:MAG TPA: HD domain-containing protein [Symbiobacteriaceae bacterium]|jgi:(p)ppGpp synthase/HD superfamily hydrolase
MDLVAKAIELAARHHAGAVDKGGAPYILHPMRVMMRVATSEERMAAAMHDLIEDCGVTPADLLGEGFPREVVDAVVALTRGPGETYLDFVRRAKGNAIARAVKIADIQDNLDLSRIPDPAANDHARVDRYRQALELLLREI